MTNEADSLLGAIRERAGAELPFYSEIYAHSLKEVPPVFFSKEYEEFFWQCALTIPNWLPRVVAACATTEGNGAHSLIKIWSCIHGHPDAEAGLLQHAKDEIGHARLFVKLAQLAFDDNYAQGNLIDLKNSIQPLDETELTKSSANPVSERMLIDYMIQLNIVEIRTRKHLIMMAPMYYALAPEPNKRQVEKILNGLERDEMSHITYTARVIDKYASEKNVRGLKGVFQCRLHNYNEHTIEHCDASKYDYGQGKIPMMFAPSCGGACRLNADPPRG